MIRPQQGRTWVPHRSRISPGSRTPSERTRTGSMRYHTTIWKHARRLVSDRCRGRFGRGSGRCCAARLL
jgi:hypothetical protein